MPKNSPTFSETYVTSPSADRTSKNPSNVCSASCSCSIINSLSAAFESWSTYSPSFSCSAATFFPMSGTVSSKKKIKTKLSLVKLVSPPRCQFGKHIEQSSPPTLNRPKF